MSNYCDYFQLKYFHLFDKRKQDWLRREWPVQNRDDE